jgi:hypothetical protein
MIINFNNKNYNTKREFSNYIKNLIKNEIGICNSLKSTKYWNEILELMKRHPEYNDKIKNMKDVIIRYSFFNNIELCIINNDNSETTFSYITAIEGKGNSDKYELTSAMRECISYQILDYRNNNNLICKNCNSIDNIEIDHIIPFSKLRDDFISICKTNNTNIPNRFIRKDKVRREFKCEDFNFKKDWIYYHLINSEFQPLCRECNLKKSNKII